MKFRYSSAPDDLEIIGYTLCGHVCFRALYALEKQFKELTIEQRYLLRQEKSKPLMADLKQWCDDNVAKTTKDSALGKAIRYTINQWNTLLRYLEDGNLQIDNNAAERTSSRL